MNPFVTLIAAEHLQDLLREAEAERRLRILRSGGSSVAKGRSTSNSDAAAMSHHISKSRAVGRRIVPAIRNIVERLRARVGLDRQRPGAISRDAAG